MVYSKATALLLKEKMSQMYIPPAPLQVLVMFPLIPVDVGYPPLLSFFFLSPQPQLTTLFLSVLAVV